MFKGFYNLTSGMLTQGRNLDVISNNMTNVATSGFKTDQYTFSTFEEVMWKRSGNMDRKYTDLGEQSWITAPSKLYTDYTQGTIEETGQNLDFAIEGDGFFALETNEGRVYTRNGNFSLDNEGYLWLSGYGRVLDTAFQPMRVVTDQLRADEAGNIRTENGTLLGQLGVFRFEDNGALEKNERGFFVSQNDGQLANDVRVHQKFVERSNIDMVQQMSQLIAAQRAYQSAAEATKIYDEMMTKATTQVGTL